MSNTIETRLENNVFYLVMNRPESLNAANEEMLTAMAQALLQAERDPDVRCVVITGNGRGFCSGADLKAGIRGSLKEHLDKTFRPVVSRMRLMGKPVVTAVNGIAAGAGASIALAGDIRVFASSAVFVEAFIGIALIPDAGSTWFLPRLVGYNRAFDLMVNAEKVSAEDAYKMGLCERVYPDNEFQTRVKDLAERLAAGPTLTIGLTKRALNKAMTVTFEEALEYEGQLQDIAGASHDFKEGVAAFLEKRPAKFLGK
ncbi:MAG: enoyl-CoA hydratase-related protein [Deinococcales bacterium]